MLYIHMEVGHSLLYCTLAHSFSSQVESYTGAQLLKKLVTTYITMFHVIHVCDQA